MKKLIIFTLFVANLSFAQNSSETNPSGTVPVLRSTGFGSVPQISGFSNKASILGHTGSTSTNSHAIGVLGYSDNSSATNYGVYGYANGAVSTDNVGVYGLATVINSKGFGIKGFVSSSSIASDFMYGGQFITANLPGINGGNISYGVYAQAGGQGAIATSYGLFAITSSNISTISNGVYGESNSLGGTGNEFGGSFIARGFSTGVIKTGVQAKSSGTTFVQTRYGVEAVVDGPSTTSSYGVSGTATNTGNGVTYGGYFKALGTGLGNKIGLYATASGVGNVYAANLEGKVGIGTLGSSGFTTIENTNIDSWNGVNGTSLNINSNNNAGAYLGGNLQINNTGGIYLNNSSIAGGVYRTKTGPADMLPIAYGHISQNGVVLNSSTSNVTASKTSTGTYSIAVTGETFGSSLAAHTVLVSLNGTYGFIKADGNGTNIIVNTTNTTGNLTDSGFTFVIYK